MTMPKPSITTPRVSASRVTCRRLVVGEALGFPEVHDIALTIQLRSSIVVRFDVGAAALKSMPSAPTSQHLNPGWLHWVRSIVRILSQALCLNLRQGMVGICHHWSVLAVRQDDHAVPLLRMIVINA